MVEDFAGGDGEQQDDERANLHVLTFLTNSKAAQCYISIAECFVTMIVKGTIKIHNTQVNDEEKHARPALASFFFSPILLLPLTAC